MARFFPEAVVADCRSALFELLWRWEYKYTCTTAALNQADKAAIRAIVASLGLAQKFASSECHGEGDDEKFFAHCVPSLRMDWGETDDYSRVGGSRVQGIPDFPLTMKWPCVCVGAEGSTPWGPDIDKTRHTLRQGFDGAGENRADRRG